MPAQIAEAGGYRSSGSPSKPASCATDRSGAKACFSENLRINGGHPRATKTAASCGRPRLGTGSRRAIEWITSTGATPKSQLFDWSPACVGIVLGHRGAESGGVRPEVLLVNDAVLAANERLDAAVAIGGGPGDHAWPAIMWPLMR